MKDSRLMGWTITARQSTQRNPFPQIYVPDSDIIIHFISIKHVFAKDNISIQHDETHLIITPHSSPLATTYITD